MQIAYVVSSLRDRPVDLSSTPPTSASRNAPPAPPETTIPGPDISSAGPVSEAAIADEEPRQTGTARPRTKRSVGKELARSRISERPAARGRVDTNISRDFGTVVILYKGQTAGPDTAGEAQAKVKTESVRSAVSKPSAPIPEPSAEKPPRAKKRPLFARVMMPIVKSPWRLIKAIGSKLN